MDDALKIAKRLFFQGSLSQDKAGALLAEVAHGRDDSDAFFEYHRSEGLTWDEGTLKSIQDETRRGFSVRVISGDKQALAHSNDLSLESFKRATASVSHLTNKNVKLAPAPIIPNEAMYEPIDPIGAMPLKEKIACLAKIDSYARGQDAAVTQCLVSLNGAQQIVLVLRPDGACFADSRPLVRLNVRVTLKKGNRIETGFAGAGGRASYAQWLNVANWQKMVDDAIQMARVNMDAIDAPAGECSVVLGNGWPGILLHEAIGHGLEGDFNRKGLSAFAGLMGERIAAQGITVVDDATLAHKRGSLTMDDEGTGGQCTTLIEDGILCGFMQDRMNARLMNVSPTGNGRRESYAHSVMPRMTNTYMLAGTHDKNDIIASVKKGIYASQFGGGQVDITSGQFVFSASSAFLIEDGKITRPIKGATLIGSGATALKNISMVGDDMALDDGIGTCGKEGQLVPVGVGQPSLRIDQLTVGGTQT